MSQVYIGGNRTKDILLVSLAHQKWPWLPPQSIIFLFSGMRVACPLTPLTSVGLHTHALSWPHHFQNAFGAPIYTRLSEGN